MMKYPVDGFPVGKWQVNWYGDIQYRDRTKLYSQPTIALILFAVDGRVGNHVRSVNVAFSLISIIPLGSIWENGILVEDFVDSEAQRLDLTVFPENTKLVRAGETISGTDGSPYLLPFGKFNAHESHTSSFCLRLKSSTEQVVLVPAVEVIRFYFGSSTDLLKRIVTNQLGDPDLWSHAECDAERNARIQISGDVNAASAADIARIAFDPVAQRTAEIVGRSLTVAQASANKKLYAKAALPFSGPTKLRLAGVAIEVPGEPERFMGMRIESCRARFPFDRLTYSGGRARNGQRSNEKSRSSRKTMDEAEREIRSVEPDSWLKPRVSSQRVKVRFPDLMGKPVQGMVFSSEGEPHGGSSTSNEMSLGVGAGKSSGKAPP